MAESDSNPSWKLSSVPLNGINYVSWSKAVTLSLGGKKKLGFLDGSKKCPPTTESGYEDWIAHDSLIRSWLINSMEPHIAQIFTFSDYSKELWESVTEMYGNQNNVARIFELKLEIAAAQQGDKTFSEHLGYLKRLWDEFSVYRPHTTDTQTLLKRAEEDKIFSLLSGLKPEYENIRSNVLMDAKLPSFAAVCATIQREETQKKFMTVETQSTVEKINSSVLLAERKYVQMYRNTSRDKGRKEPFFCDHCKKPGHTKDRCWELQPHLKSEKKLKDHTSLAQSSISMNQLGHILQQLSQSVSSHTDHSGSTHASGSRVEEDDW